jgi:UDP-3-O-[3-hydroxymyristoyl] glucosamine N-acyltransferase
MHIRDIADLSKSSVIVRDCYFSTLGKLNALNQDGTLIFLSDEKCISQTFDKRISGIVASKAIADKLLNREELGIMVSDNPKEDFYLIHEYLVSKNYFQKTLPTTIGENTYISKSAVISDQDVIIGDNCIIGENVILEPGVEVKNNSIIRAGCIIGEESIEIFRKDRKNRMVPHGGKVIIGSDVEILPHCIISKGLFPGRNTEISDDTIIDNMVYIAHGNQIGEDTIIAAKASISGNCTVGSNTWIGPGVIISNGIKIGSNAYISIGSVVTRNVPDHSKKTGNFAIDHDKFMMDMVKKMRD